ncbi:uncharacterized protein [Montipora foliosa]|uniref:uncharacterized protein n=1 Tax=Montipora foliosa TaxID=591990 RepID=UPI0035F17E81
MALQVKVDYGGERFATFVLRNVTYKTLLQTTEKNCSPLAHLGQDSIRLPYKDEDGDFVNISPDNSFAFSEMLRTAKQVGDRDYKKFYIKAHEVNSPVPQKMRRLDSGGLSTSAVFSGGELEPKQLTFSTLAPSPLDLKEEELKENLTALQVQLSTAREELNNLKQQDKEFVSLSSIRARMCTFCHVAGHTKTICKNEPCTNISCCKVRDKHPEHRANIQELQHTMKNLEKQSADKEANIKGLSNARERAKSSFFAIMRPRLRAQNLIKYASGKRLQLDRDLLALQRALNNRVPEWGVEEDWQLQQI